MMANKTEIQVQMGLLAGQNGGGYAEAVQSYFEHYGLDYPNAAHRFGWFESRGLKLAGHVWMPVGQGPTLREIKGTVIVLHGYLNHTGQMKHLIAGLLESGFAVGSFDLPGHGLSEGQSAAVGAFEDYTQALLDYVLTIRPLCAQPLHFIGFSTGAGVGIELLLNDKEKRKLDSRLRGNDTSLYSELFDKVVLASPLIHWRRFNASKAMYAFYRAFTEKAPRVPQRNSSNKDFLSFNRHSDYLHCRYVSLDWVRALYDWNDRLESMPVCDKEVLILQGDRDTTVDWRYNIRLLQGKFPAANVQMIKGARHELFNETAALRDECLAKISTYLAGKTPDPKITD